MVVSRPMDLSMLDSASDYILREYVTSIHHVFGLAPQVPKPPNRAPHACGASISWLHGTDATPHGYRTEYADTISREEK